MKDPHMKHCLQFGVGMHHAGLEPSDRQIAEDLFARCKILVLVCTSTLAWGVNLPAHLVVIKGTEFYDGKQRRYVDFPITDALQMMGKSRSAAVRRLGDVRHHVSRTEKGVLQKVSVRAVPGGERFVGTFARSLQRRDRLGVHQSKQDAIDWITWTYFFRRLMRNPSYYDLESVDHKSVNAYLSALVEGAFENYADAALRRRERRRRRRGASEPGQSGVVLLPAAQYRGFVRANHELSKHSERLAGRSSRARRSTTRRRCGIKDLLNATLADAVVKAGGFPVDARSLDDPHVKANLLFQAHWLRVPLPSSDFVTDAKGALDNAARVLQAMIDARRGRGVAGGYAAPHEPAAGAHAGAESGGPQPVRPAGYLARGRAMRCREGTKSRSH